MISARQDQILSLLKIPFQITGCCWESNASEYADSVTTDACLATGCLVGGARGGLPPASPPLMAACCCCLAWWMAAVEAVMLALSESSSACRASSSRLSCS